MKVLLLSAANSVHTLRWANAYAAKGCEVHLVTQHRPLEGYAREVKVHRLPHRAGLGYVMNGPQVKQLVALLRPDVVNAHYATGYGTLARWCDPVPVVLNVWGSDVHEFPEKSVLHRSWLLRNLLGVRLIVSTSEAMARQVRSLIDEALPVVVVPFGVDTERFKPAPDKPKDGPIIIGTVKTLMPVYGVDLLIKAFSKVEAVLKAPSIRLRIVGGGKERRRLEQMVREDHLADRVEFIGAVSHDRVPDELRELDIYVALSREESFGVAVVEAQACGIPVVVSDVGGLPEVVAAGESGMVVPAEDVEAAAEALRTLISDPELRERMGKAGRTRVQEHFEWDHCVDRMMTVLQDVFANKAIC